MLQGTLWKVTANRCISKVHIKNVHLPKTRSYLITDSSLVQMQMEYCFKVKNWLNKLTVFLEIYVIRVYWILFVFQNSSFSIDGKNRNTRTANGGNQFRNQATSIRLFSASGYRNRCKSPVCLVLRDPSGVRLVKVNMLYVKNPLLFLRLLLLAFCCCP